jgi:hypothetical protein
MSKTNVEKLDDLIASIKTLQDQVDALLPPKQDKEPTCSLDDKPKQDKESTCSLDDKLKQLKAVIIEILDEKIADIHARLDERTTELGTEPDPLPLPKPKNRKRRTRGPEPFQLNLDWKVRQLETHMAAGKHPDFERKKKTIVLERLPEKTTETDDIALLQKVVGAVTTDPDLNIAAEVSSIRRHGRKREGQSKPRLVKVDFKSEIAARKFMIHYRRLSKDNNNEPAAASFARRDLTPTELELQQELRQLAYQINQKAGRAVCFYRDLNIFNTESR